MKQTIRYKVTGLSIYDFDGYLNDIIDMLTKYKDYPNVKLDVDCDYRDNSYEIFVIADREETEEEYSARLEKELDEAEKKQKQLLRLKEQKELAIQLTEVAEHQTYLRLKAKYEKT